MTQEEFARENRAFDAVKAENDLEDWELSLAIRKFNAGQVLTFVEQAWMDHYNDLLAADG